jgi:hypothetical protein
VGAAGEVFYESSYQSVADARTKLQALVASELLELAFAARNRQRAAIGCADGTVLIVEYRRGWMYSITGPGYTRCSSTGLTCATFREACAAAVEHACQSYGGARWESAY